jgi:hypothetical protein
MLFGERRREEFFKEGNFLEWHVMKKGIERAEEGRGGQLVRSGTL